MRLNSIRMFAHEGVFGGSVPSGHREVSVRQGCVHVVTTAGGAMGLGEASPLPGTSPDSFEDACAALAATQAALTDASFESVQAVAAFTELHVSSQLPSVRFAIETAVLDALAREQGVAVSALFGIAPVVRVTLSALLANDRSVARADWPRFFQEAESMVGQGFTTLKLKVARHPWMGESERLMALRERLGPSVALRLDANGGYSGRDVASVLERFALATPELIEEPTSALWLRAELPVAWAADETFAAHVEDYLANRHCSAVVLKPTTLGFFQTLEYGERALRSRKSVILTHAFEGPIALAACFEIALILASLVTHLRAQGVVTGEVLACGLAWHAALEAWPRARWSQLIEPAALAASQYLGLGVEFNESIQEILRQNILRQNTSGQNGFGRQIA